MKSLGHVEVQRIAPGEDGEKGRDQNASLDHGPSRNPCDPGSVNEQEYQAGVHKALALNKAWSRTTLIIAFSSLFITTLTITFSDYSGMVVEPYVTSSFKKHSAMSAAHVVVNITRIIAYPVIAKLSDVFGRAEMFALSIFFQTLSYILFATSQNIGNYFTAGLFDAVGSTGFGLTQQVFIADSTSLVDRAFWSTLPETLTTIPALYLGSLMGQSFLTRTGWRWAYGTWAMVVPVVSVPLIGTVMVLQRRAAKQGLLPPGGPAAAAAPSAWGRLRRLLWTEIDLPGLVLLVAGLSLILIPLSLTGSLNPGRWREASFIAMVVVGAVLLVSFVEWDVKFAKRPYIPARMANRTVIAACLIQVFDFMEYSLFTIFFSSYLQVAGHYSPAHATRIDNSLRVAFQVSGLFVALGMKYTRKSRMWALMGPPLVIIGQGVMIYLVNPGGDRRSGEAAFVACKVISGIGRALFQTAAQVSVQAAVSQQEVAVATSLFQAGNSVGAALGTSVSGAIWRNTLPDKLVEYLPESDKGKAMSIFQSIVNAKKYEIGSPVRLAIDRSFRESQMLLAIVATALCVPNLVIMWFIKSITLEDEKKEQGEESEAPGEGGTRASEK
ncbi:siderophore iron transporter mirA [Cordyceps fumosorosea ARSEF 2679]|uniref:Siderophore iron transporter mirA n=1 Tax=Cordyceps fumosorosea (strain ARSEF 2679) TaxID=1081104 RepID=A0A167IME4_CORFA|nr:siderophore iron transporter mirA [Cordyceps fumosorosea ARSEF 2679]OAA49229.1 siderophore iron transporter mirA [Cordyceps fumosorosea ARSEF 2679]